MVDKSLCVCVALNPPGNSTGDVSTSVMKGLFNGVVHCTPNWGVRLHKFPNVAGKGTFPCEVTIWLSTCIHTPLRVYTSPAVNGQAARVGCWRGRGRRHAAEFSKPPTHRLGRLSRTVTVSDPLLQNLLVNISCNANSVVL